MSEKFNLERALREAADDESVDSTGTKPKKASQEDIKKIVVGRRTIQRAKHDTES